MHPERTSVAGFLTKVRHKSLAERVFEDLSNAILTGALEQGERLNESVLSQKMGVSRAPVREALSKLVKHGLALQKPRKGTFVEEWNKQDLQEVATLRSVLEGLAAKLASSNLESPDIHYLEDAIECMATAEKKKDNKQLIDLDYLFHARIYECSEHKRLQRTLENLSLQIRFFRIITRPSDIVSYPEQHKILLEAIRSQDPERAQQVAIEHVMSSAMLVLENISYSSNLGEKVMLREGGDAR